MLDFTNETIDLEKLPQYQETELHAPNPNYWKVIVIHISIILILIAAAFTLLVLLVDEKIPNMIYFIVSFIVIGFLLFPLYRASFKKRGYALREKDIMFKHGIIAETTTIVPLNRIQHVALDEGLFSRMYGLATLQIYTAGGQTGHLQIAGIEADKAKAIKEILLKKIELVENETDTKEELNGI